MSKIGVEPGELAAALRHQRPAPVVEEAGIGDPEQAAEDDVPLVAGAADRVVALVAALQLPSHEVQVAADHLGLEELERGPAVEAGAGAERRRAVADRPPPGRGGTGRGEVRIDDGSTIDGGHG